MTKRSVSGGIVKARVSFTYAVLLLTSLSCLGCPHEAIAQPAAESLARCDEACLRKVMDDFVAAMTNGQSSAVPLAEYAEVRENTTIARLPETSWPKVKKVRSILTFTDTLSGNVLSRAGVELADGSAAYLSTRLKVVALGRIADVEISADTTPRVVGAYVWNLDPMLTAVLPPNQRLSRVQLEALARRYFHSLSSHQPELADFDERCDRFHSGRQVTNVRNNSVENGAPRTCASSLGGNPPWGPATDQRFPVIDPDRGIVFGVTLLHYLGASPPSQMYVAEVFKVVSGRIVRIDNIGLMMQGTTTLGFTH